MSSGIVPSSPQGAAPFPLPASGAVAGVGTSLPATAAGARLSDQIARSLSALRRYIWLIVAIVAAGSSVGYALTRFVTPKYSVNASIWIAKPSGSTGPISSPGLITDALSWQDLARSYIVMDAVVSRLALYVQPGDAATTPVFRNLLPTDSLVPGRYGLAVDASGSTYTLTRKGEQRGQQDRVVEQGTVGDSIGHKVGFLWVPSTAALRQALQKKSPLEFSVITPREASLILANHLSVVGPSENGNLMRMTLTGTNGPLLATTLNAIQHEFVNQAAWLKTQNLEAVSATVDSQLARANEQLANAEQALQTFKVRTITEPTENTPVAGGVAVTESPVLSDFFKQNLDYKMVQRDREALEKILNDAKAQGGRISMEALRSMPLLLATNKGLSDEKLELETSQTLLRKLRLTYTDSFPKVQDLIKKIDILETQTIPQLAAESWTQLKIQEQELSRRIAGAASDIQKIPPRMVEEQRRLREVSVAEKIATDLRTREVGAKLAKLSALPDISILDSAVAPSQPTTDTKTNLFLAAVGLSILVALGLALLLDRMDKRFRYPEQATTELGLDILGAVPTLTNPRSSAARLQEATQLVEAFRSLSLSVRSAFDSGSTVQFTVSSPGPGDGKSFISANLASALADGGFRTLLIDGDIRRGTLHSVFAPMEQAPGLLDYLSGESVLGEIVRPTSHGNLFLVPCGKRRRHGPELLAGQGMSGFIRDVGAQFDAIVVDSAPLGAGIDPFALGVATGAMLLVLRTGETDRRLAQSKLEVLDRLPVRVLGTVLNDIGENAQFRYYYYLEGYDSIENGSDRAERLTSGNGASEK
jgi:capsular exopolysaccharide synthesis family protein